MITLLVMIVITTVTVLYLARKGWHALHKIVGITPGVLIYQNPNQPLSPSNMTWEKLTFTTQHLSVLPEHQLRQLQHIDKKLATYHNDQQTLELQKITPAVSEEQFLLHKLLYTRLPEMLASHYRLLGFNNRLLNVKSNTNAGFTTENIKHAEASQLLQEALDNIEGRLDCLLEKLETQSLEELRVMKNYLNSHH